MKYEFGLCGPFDFEEKNTGGQSVKTREFYYALCECCGRENIKILESTGYKRNPMLFAWRMIVLMSICENVVVFPAQNGIKVLAPLCCWLKKIFHTKTYYNVIGGWLGNLVDEKPKLKKSLRDFNCIFVETNVMKQELKKRGIYNSEKLVNFKRTKAIDKDEVRKVERPVKLCYFSRVTKMKGIADAVQVVNKINKGETRCVLDIYGPIADGYDAEFEQLKLEFGKEIVYKGKSKPTEGVRIISKYDLQLFPTHYKTEGIPGSILDSYFAGVPIIAAKWNSYNDVILENQTGIGYEIGNIEEFYEKLNEIISDSNKIMQMKYMALQESEKYTSETVLNEFLKIARR